MRMWRPTPLTIKLKYVGVIILGLARKVGPKQELGVAHSLYQPGRAIADLRGQACASHNKWQYLICNILWPTTTMTNKIYDLTNCRAASPARVCVIMISATRDLRTHSYTNIVPPPGPTYMQHASVPNSLWTQVT